MRLLLAVLLLLMAAPGSPALAEAPDTARQWLRVPEGARMAYMTGAAAGMRAYSMQENGKPLLLHVRIDRAVDNMTRMAKDPIWGNKLFIAVAAIALTDAQDKGIVFVDTGKPLRDTQFDDTLLFTRPWLAPLDLNVFVPTAVPGSAPTFAQTWLSSPYPQKQSFINGFGDMVSQQCLDNYGDSQEGNACVKPLLPLPIDLVIAGMDGIYREKTWAKLPYDVVIRAVLAKMVGGDWEAILNEGQQQLQKKK